MSEPVKLHIEKSYSGNGIDTFIINGLSVEETNKILNAADEEKDRKDVLADILDAGQIYKSSFSKYGEAYCRQAAAQNARTELEIAG